MGIGEFFLNESTHIPDQSFTLISYSREALAANVKYLHEKYAQWFVEFDENEVNQIMSTIFQGQKDSIV